MNPLFPHTGFTRKELALAIGLLVTGISCFSLAQESAKADAGMISSRNKARDMHTLLTAWAQDNDQAFPPAEKYSNEAFRVLFTERLVDREDLFEIPGDAWHKSSTSGKGPDGNIGNRPEFKQALTSGECAFAYVTQLETASRSDVPLIANGFSETPGVYSNDKSKPGGVFGGTKAMYVTVGGSAKVVDLDADFKIKAMKDGKMVDVFSKEWGTNPDNIKNPDGRKSP